MKTINSEFDEYRDCLRLVWNLALRHRPKGGVSYPDVSQALLEALVLDELQDASLKNTGRLEVNPGDLGYIPGLGVLVNVSYPGILKPTESSGVVDWVDVGAHDPLKGALLHYVDVFDFKSADETYDLDYVRAVTLSGLGNAAKGSSVIVRRSCVDIVDLTG